MGIFPQQNIPAAAFSHSFFQLAANILSYFKSTVIQKYFHPFSYLVTFHWLQDSVMDFTRIVRLTQGGA